MTENDEKCVECKIENAVYVNLGDSRADFHSGISIVDVTFPRPTTFNVISFKNFYVANLTVKVNTKDVDSKGKWVTCVKDFKLMPGPHCEWGGQDKFRLDKTHMNFVPSNVKRARLILRQPSPVWMHSSLSDIKFYVITQVPNTAPDRVEAILERNSENSEQLPRLIEKGLAVEEIASGLQQMWALTQKVELEQTEQALGRFDVDGSYEISLLSYTALSGDS